MKIRNLRWKLAAAVPAGVLAAGLGVMALGSAGPALADIPLGTCVTSTVAPADANCTTDASVTVSSYLTFADNTPSITFDAPAVLPGSSTNSPDISLSVWTNDTAGYSISATAADMAGTGTNPNTIPIQDMQINSQPFPAGSPSTLETDSSTTTSDEAGDPVNFTDSTQLYVPNVAPDTYSTVLTYTTSGN